jgi:ABC-type molybdate transport system substrate-binding protein
LTQRLLTARGVLDAVQKNVSFTSPTADMLALELVEGKLDAAVVYQANTTRQRGRLEVISLSDPGALAVQPFAVARDSDHAQLAGRLRQAILSAASRQRFEAAGFRWRAPSEAP